MSHVQYIPKSFVNAVWKCAVMAQGKARIIQVLEVGECQSVSRVGTFNLLLYLLASELREGAMRLDQSGYNRLCRG
jgi:hypothetical protein